MNNVLKEEFDTISESDTDSDQESDSIIENEDIDIDDEDNKDDKDIEDDNIKDDNEDDENNDEDNEYDYDENDDNNIIKDNEDNVEDDDCIYTCENIDETDINSVPYEVPSSDRITDRQLTHYERIRILGIRAKQISMGAKVMVKPNNTNIGAVELAKYELNNKTTPLIIKRSLPNNSYELWKVSELEFNDDDKSNILKDLNDTFKLSYTIKV
jgi:DNA-directed RNA polymerase subunit K/omega